MRVLLAIYENCREAGIRIVVVLGPGYAHHRAIDGAVAGLDPSVVELVRSTPVISEYMQRAELAVTSGGRTVLELAALHTPTIVICQNAREETHTFTPGRLGVINLGNRSTVTDEAIVAAFRTVAGDEQRRLAMANDLAASDLRHGKQRVMSLLNDLLTRERP
jgi:spore coat polysaccharide biosynthesis predicted glycosyltransferase SpsG